MQREALTVVGEPDPLRDVRAILVPAGRNLGDVVAEAVVEAHGPGAPQLEPPLLARAARVGRQLDVGTLESAACRLDDLAAVALHDLEPGAPATDIAAAGQWLGQ